MSTFDQNNLSEIACFNFLNSSLGSRLTFLRCQKAPPFQYVLWWIYFSNANRLELFFNSFPQFFWPKSGDILSQKKPTFSNFKVCEKFKDLSEDLTFTVVWSKKESVLQRKVVTFQKVCSETNGFFCFEKIFVLKFLGFFLFGSVLLFCFSLWCHVQNTFFLFTSNLFLFFFVPHVLKLLFWEKITIFVEGFAVFKFAYTKKLVL